MSDRARDDPANDIPEPRPDEGQLRGLLDELGVRDLPHVERLTLATAVISEAFRKRGMRATLVGGGAIEFYAPAAYTTTDIDLIVERGDRRALQEVFASLGFERRHRHWVRDDLFVEVPGTEMWDPVEEVSVGPFTLRVVRKEVALADRIVGFKYWRYTGYGIQAIDMIAAFGDSVDEDLLVRYLRREGAEDAYRALQALARSPDPITQDVLASVVEHLARGEDRRRDTHED